MPTRFLWSVWSKQLVCFVHWQGQERRTKTYNKEVCQVLRFLSINYGQPQPTGTSHCFYPSDLTYLTLTGLTGFL